MNILPLIEQQHGAQVANSLVGVATRGNQLEALELAKVSRIAEHVNVEQLGHISAPPQVVILAKSRPNVGALFLHNRSLFGCRASRPNLTYQITQANWCGNCIREPLGKNKLDFSTIIMIAKENTVKGSPIVDCPSSQAA